MWFKNLQLYRLGKTFDMDPEVFDGRLQADAFKGCNSMDMLTYGWAPPLGRHGQHIHAVATLKRISLETPVKHFRVHMKRLSEPV